MSTKSDLAIWTLTNSTNKIIRTKVGIILHHSAGMTENLQGIFNSRHVSTCYSVSPTSTRCYVDELYDQWSTGTKEGNEKWISIECVNSSGAPDWAISRATIERLIPLVADIAKRNGFYPLIKSANIRQHKDFVATYCSGHVWDYIDEIITRANALIGGGTQSSAPVPAPATRPIVRYGSSGEYVKQVQKAVNVTPDGVYGLLTQNAVAKFQKQHGLTPDGIVGPATWQVIDAGKTLDVPAAKPQIAKPILSVGSTGDDVQIVQKIVGANPDGVFGAATKAAVKKWQTAKKLISDGIVGQATWKAMGY